MSGGRWNLQFLKLVSHPLLRYGVVEAVDADVFLAGALLGLDKAGGAIDADDQATRHLIRTITSINMETDMK